MDHRKFFKDNRVQMLNVAEYVPNITLDEDNKLHDFISNHLLLLFFSTSCSSCIPAIEALEEFTNMTTKYKILILMDAESENIAYMRELFHKKANVYFMTREDMLHDVKVHRIPRGFALNQEGQVLSTNACFDVQMIHELVKPLSVLSL